MNRLTPERLEAIRSEIAMSNEMRRSHAYPASYCPDSRTELLAEIDALRTERDEARKFYGPAGLRAVSSFIEERDRLRDLLERCRDRLDDADESDELYCQVNMALEEKNAQAASDPSEKK